MLYRYLTLLFITTLVLYGCGGKRYSSVGAKPRNEPVSKYGNPKTYKVLGKTYKVRDSSKGYKETGIASWYGDDFHGKRTSSGTSYDMHSYSAAHKTLPIPTYVKVTNLENRKSVIVRVDDRGPFVSGRIIDLSNKAAKEIGMIGKGTAKVRVEALAPYQNLKNKSAAYGASSNSNTAIIPTPPPPTTTVSGSYTLQLNAFSNEYNANNFLNQVKQTYKLPAEIHHDGQFYRVVTYRYADRAAAEDGARNLQSKGLSAKIFNI